MVCITVTYYMLHYVETSNSLILVALRNTLFFFSTQSVNPGMDNSLSTKEKEWNEDGLSSPMKLL